MSLPQQLTDGLVPKEKVEWALKVRRSQFSFLT
jgi:hypothetical protein